MTTCHDPYRELELYLEQAQEEIGLAIKELEDNEVSLLSDDSLDWKNLNDTLILPPQGFRSEEWNNKTNCELSRINADDSSSVNRVCYEGNILDFGYPATKFDSSHNSIVPRTSFASSFSTSVTGKNGKTICSPNTRKRLWRMHQSISFPETSKDLLLLGKDPQTSDSLIPNGRTQKSPEDNYDFRTLQSCGRKCRQRSNSDTLPSSLSYTEPHLLEEFHAFPRPPSGDVNLLSIWADNLVLELDKSLSGELMNFAESFSPSSDYSLSPIKQDENFKDSNFASTHSESDIKQNPEESNEFLLTGKNLKLVSRSPDSGIEQISCNTPDFSEDCVDCAPVSRKKVKGFSSDLLISDKDTDYIAPPPPQFKDENHSIRSIKDRSQATQTTHFCRKPSCLKSAEYVLEAQEMVEPFNNDNKGRISVAHAIPIKTIELENSPVVRTLCVINDGSEMNKNNDTHQKSISSDSKDKNLKGNNLLQPQIRSFFSSLPKPPKTPPNNADKWSSLPRDGGKSPDLICPQRSVSHSAVSNVNYVSIDELATFMRQMKSDSYQLPACADVSTDVKDDKENRDAVTQTTPPSLSRSSSFTWVTECDCSDWDVQNEHSDTDESLVMSGCSNCKAENRDLNSSSSSLDISSNCDDCLPASPGSAASSLYLSACSGSSDSFEEASVALVNDDTSSDYFKFPDGDLDQNNHQQLRSSEITLRGSTLGNISEEQITSETISVRSNISNPSLADSNNTDPQGQSASFPSTLRMSRKNQSTGSPAQPIEPTVLVINDLNLKSVSAPVLMRQKRHVASSKTPESSSSDSSPPTGARNKDSMCASYQVPPRAHSAKELNELQAIEACSWLRAAGFPQYAQMYEDNQFPIDISIVQKDHAFLHPDSIQSLFRRLNTLNRCAKMKFMDHAHRKTLYTEDSDDEEQYALSENWEFQRSSRRWSRIPSPLDDATEFVAKESLAASKPTAHLLTTSGRKYLSPEEAYCSSHDSVFVDEQHSSPDSIRRSTLHKSERISVSPSNIIGDCSPGSSSGSGGTLSLVSEDMQERRTLRRSGSDRVKEGAKALLKRMESLKGKKKKKALDTNKSQTAHSGNDGSSSSSLTSSPQLRRSQKTPHAQSDTSLRESDSVLYKSKDDMSAHSDSECRLFLVSNRQKDANSNNEKGTKLCNTSVTVTCPPEEYLSETNKEGDKEYNYLKPEFHTKTFLCSESPDGEKNKGNRGSYYDNVCAPLVVFNDLFTEVTGDAENKNRSKTKGAQPPFTDQDFYENQEDGDIIILNKERRDSGVGSSLQRGITYHQAPWHYLPFHRDPDATLFSNPIQITELTAPQMLLIRKLSLLKLTTIMEKFSPSSRTGWTWGVQKFICRIRNPDYKDKVVFGVPLLLILQRTGQPLPVSIQAAIQHLRKTALDSTGLFRKSGVRSRIQKLKTLNETIPEKISYEEQQAYDVADMLKQYFRELPEALLTNKLSETFISIFQYVPEELRLEAIRAALMLMPDENREVLQSLLEFLHEVCQHSGINQMTATNIAVCFAPSLFHLSTPRSASSSPRRRKTVGVPDLRELNENRAAYECLSCMVTNYETLFTVSEEMLSQSRITSTSYFQPATLEDLSSFVCNGQSGWKGYVDSCIQIFLKEAKEKYRGWKAVSQNDHVELAYKKLSDGHPLKLWKVTTEIEAPPVELLNRILRERHLWDSSFSKWKVITRLAKHTEVFQYLSTFLPPHPPCDYCVLRSWRTDLPKGACILIETSIEHPEAEKVPGSVRALVLASRYLIEPCGSGKSRITYISRIDTRGRSPEWYNRAYGHICTLLLVKLRSSFSRCRADGPETKV
ncbi:rho GTPase-activating protein 7-like isoform X2 [Argiope bruennichi]|uniref:StAR-related lipid transfer protein 13 like protein n=1 Tax=Argiope bruennichi TaxID=94029 RepID=A0A8T0F1K4_ARGBR|nr:rho GTPase-activating protein 7-like isoform X2 [Argiope bruennichi]KAF8784362.1 StAR-related lipid transfer protein 13 like protein [Argiope bruennichi]